MAGFGGPQAMGHEEASRPVNDQVQAVRTSFLAIVRGLKKSGHIVLSLLTAATAAGCWAGLYWGTQSAPVMEAALVVILLYAMLQVLDQKQAAALTCHDQPAGRRRLELDGVRRPLRRVGPRQHAITCPEPFA